MLDLRLYGYPVRIFHNHILIAYDGGEITIKPMDATGQKGLSESESFNGIFIFLSNNSKTSHYTYTIYGLSLKNIYDLVYIMESSTSISRDIAKYLNNNKLENITDDVVRFI